MSCLVAEAMADTIAQDAGPTPVGTVLHAFAIYMARVSRSTSDVENLLNHLADFASTEYILFEQERSTQH